MKKAAMFFIALYPLTIFGQNKSFKLWYQDGFASEALKILATGIVTFIISYILLRLQKQRRDKKQISYDLEIKNGLLEVDESIKQHVGISYKAHPAVNLTMVGVNVQNTGDLLIKDQQIRFTFGNSNRIVDTFFEPNVDPELFLIELESKNTFEKKYNIGHFEKNQSVNYRFIIEGDPVDIKLTPYNEEGNVEFNPRSVNKQKDERSILQNFFLIGFFFFTIPPVFSDLTELGVLMESILRIVFIILWYPAFIKSINIFIEMFLVKNQSKAGSGIVVNGNGNIISIEDEKVNNPSIEKHL